MGNDFFKILVCHTGMGLSVGDATQMRVLALITLTVKFGEVGINYKEGKQNCKL